MKNYIYKYREANIRKYLLVSLLIFLGIFSLAKSSLAAPSVSSVSGIASDGQNITIFGSGFGTNGPNILFFDNFESGTVGQDLKIGPGSATIGQWAGLNTVHPKYSSGTTVSGNKVFKVTSVAGIEGQTNAEISLPNVTETFMSWWCYVPSDSPWSGDEAGNNFNWKIMWIMQSDSADNDMYFAKFVNQTTHIIGGNNSPLPYPDTEPWQSSSMAKGTWHRYWWWMKDGYSNDGNIKLWELTATGPVQVKNVVNKTTLFPSSFRKKLSVNGYTKKMTYTQATQMFDDVYVATGPNAQARVEIGNAPTYTSSTNLTLATINIWSDTSISAIVRSGSFASGQAYLYVFDANGSINANGYPITFDGGAPPDTTPPSAPTGLSVI